MKFEKKECKPFVPITITLESEEEVKVLIEMFSMHPNDIMHHSDLDEDIIRRALNKQGNWNNTAYVELKKVVEE